jgi:UDP:flavonoid glycosyltransferase YjiC (YdhE family)
MSKCIDKDIVTREALRILKSGILKPKKTKSKKTVENAETLYLDDFYRECIEPAMKQMAKNMKKAKAKKGLS